MQSIPSDTRLQFVERTVTLQGLRPIMFDRYAGDNTTQLAWTQKIYLIPGSRTLCLPATNISSFLSSHNTNSAPKRLRDKRKYKDIANAALSFTMISPDDIPFCRAGQPIVVGDFVDGDHDSLSGLFLHQSVARLPHGIPNAKERPVLPLPWELTFQLLFLPNKEIKEQEIKNLFEDGGLAIGLGTYRGLFGKFVVSRWD